ncbi:hypothetical protein FDP41_011949 [Naegleria fowleri]|uniref:Protein FRA10AC1 n=1 Tax=Naegleria fowleri TaxID=5763 RepID=A0A6A5C8M2_NAEFO|nr:uncharacterized protein FDP41_011949 [Naegleria fowleri]KAF0982088.1 hypothetical protein FDP41_011949 [Naegleria fowleri]CAG4710623.1 unnamed protein product [Naegleria fowleri]
MPKLDREKERTEFLKRHGLLDESDANQPINGDIKKISKSEYQNDMQILKKHYQFVRPSSEQADENDDPDEAYGKTLAKEYESKLFRDYAVADLSKYKEGKLGLRWRNEKEVLDGKGDSVCGNVACSATNDLESSLLNFSYREHNIPKQCLVKVCLCPPCYRKLNKIHKKRKKEEKKLLKEEQKKKLKKELKLLTKIYEREKKAQEE